MALFLLGKTTFVTSGAPGKGFTRSVMSLRRHGKRAQTGYSVIELALVLAIVGGLTALATPFFLTYYQASRLRVGAQAVAASINQGRQLAIRQNGNVCVHINSTALQYILGSACDAAPSLGPGTDASGNVEIPQGYAGVPDEDNRIELTATADPTFNYLGAANRGGTVTVTNKQTGNVLHVTVAVSGRVSIGP
jgi:Tfp pilus assembly protein FimT